MSSHDGYTSEAERYGVKFSVNVNPYQSYTQTDPAVTLDGITYASDSETAYNQGAGLHSYGKTKTVRMTELQPLRGAGSMGPQSGVGFENMNLPVQDKIENLRMGLGPRGEIEVDDDGTNLYAEYPDAGPVATVIIADGGESYTNRTVDGIDYGQFSTTAITGGGTGFTGVINTVTLASLANTTNTWNASNPNINDPLRVSNRGRYYWDNNPYIVTAESPAVGTGVEGVLQVNFLWGPNEMLSGTITDRGSNWAIGDRMNVEQEGTISEQHGMLQVDRVASGGGEITAVTLVDAGSNYSVGDTMSIVPLFEIEDSTYGNTAPVGSGGILTVASISAEEAFPLLEGIYIKNVDDTQTALLSINDGNYWDVELGPSQAFFTRLYNVDAGLVKAKCVASGQTCSIEYLLFQGAG